MEKQLKWKGAVEWGKIYHPESQEEQMMYYNPNYPCYDTYSQPWVDEDGDLCCYRFDHDEGCWVDGIYVIASGYCESDDEEIQI